MNLSRSKRRLSSLSVSHRMPTICRMTCLSLSSAKSYLYRMLAASRTYPFLVIHPPECPFSEFEIKVQSRKKHVGLVRHFSYHSRRYPICRSLHGDLHLSFWKYGSSLLRSSYHLAVLSVSPRTATPMGSSYPLSIFFSLCPVLSGFISVWSNLDRTPKLPQTATKRTHSPIRVVPRRYVRFVRLTTGH